MKSINWDVVTPSLWSGVAGMFAGAMLLSYGFGFLSPTTADKLAKNRSEIAVVAALAPSCAADFRALPDADKRMAIIKKSDGGYGVRDAFPDSLVTLPGRSYVDYDLVRACAKIITASGPSGNV